MDQQNSNLDPHNWVHKHADYLFAFAKTRLQDQEVAKDLVQETFLAALQKVQGFEGKSSERTWLTAILKNKIIDVYRKKSTGLSTTQLEADTASVNDFFEGDGHWTAAHQPLQIGFEDKLPMEQKEFQSVLKACMDKLPVLWRSVFTLKHIDDEPSDEICTQLKVSSSNFWVIIHRTKLNLRECLQRNWI